MTTREQISEWLSGVKADLILNFDKLGLRSSGNWEDQLEIYLEEKGQGFKFGILGTDYTYWLEHGRSPNVNQSPERLKAFVGWAGSTILAEWVKRKGINANPYAVAYKIAREGVKVPNRFNRGGLITDVITDKRIDSLLKDISLLFQVNLRSDIINDLKNK